MTAASPLPDLLARVEPDYDAEMRLAEGVTCDVCAHAQRCFGFGFSKPGATSCDFWPSRFRAKIATGEGGSECKL